MNEPHDLPEEPDATGRVMYAAHPEMGKTGPRWPCSRRTPRADAGSRALPTHGGGAGGGARGDTQLAIEGPHVTPNRLLAQPRCVGDPAGGVALRDEAQYRRPAS
jgi:hypothetical protein